MKHWFTLILFFSTCAIAKEAPPGFSALEIITENYPPLNYVENGELKGSSVDILKLVYEELGLQLPDIKVLPWTRGYMLAQSNNPVLLFTTARSPARENLFQWAGHTHSSRTYLVTYEQSGINSYDPLTQHDEPIVAVNDDITQFVLEELGYPEDKIDLVDSNETLLTMLQNRSIKLLSTSESLLRTLQKHEDLQNTPLVVLAVTSKTQGYYAFSQQVDSDVVKAFQAALDNVRKQHLVILDRYGLNY